MHDFNLLNILDTDFIKLFLVLTILNKHQLSWTRLPGIPFLFWMKIDNAFLTKIFSMKYSIVNIFVGKYFFYHWNTKLLTMQSTTLLKKPAFFVANPEPPGHILFSQRISLMLVDNNLWYINPSHQIWNNIRQAPHTSPNIRGIAYDVNMPANLKLLSRKWSVQPLTG